MAGINYRSSPSWVENKNRFNGIEQTAELGLNQYDALYRNLDPQIGVFWQIDPQFESLESYSPFECMGNNPVNNVDPLGDFHTKFGAWWYSLWHGGGNIGSNKYGEWYVAKTKGTESSDGTTTVTTTLNYGKGRDKYSNAREDIASDMTIQMDILAHGVNSINRNYDSPEEAGWAAFKIGVNSMSPVPLLRSATIWTNNLKLLATKGKRIVKGINKVISVQKQARHVVGSANGGGYLNSVEDAQKVLDAVHSGEATFLGVKSNGHPVFRYNGVTGVNVNTGAGYLNQQTNVFLIKGTSSVSVVPVSPVYTPK